MDDAVRDGTAGKSHRLMIKTGELRAEVTRLMNNMPRSPEKIEVMLAMIRRVQAVDREVVAWMRNVPDEWRFRTVAWEDHVPGGDYAKAEVFPGRVDMYNHFYIASVWNISRTARLVLASLVVRCAAWVCSPVDYRTTPEYATAARTCVDTITDIIASVPCQLGWHPGKGRRATYPPDPSSSSSSQPNSDFACGQDHQVKALAGYFLTWPLTCMNSQDYTTDAQRAWIHGRLAYIGNELGVKYAHILRQLQIRIPSMLIRRDGLMASPYGAAHDYLKLVSSVRRQQAQAQMQVQQVPELPPQMSAGVFVGQLGGDGSSASPLEHAEALQKERFELHRAELLARAAGGRNAGQGQRWVAERWLTV